MRPTLVRLITAALLAAYGGASVMPGSIPAMEARLMMTPLRCSIICLAAACMWK